MSKSIRGMRGCRSHKAETDNNLLHAAVVEYSVVTLLLGNVLLLYVGTAGPNSAPPPSPSLPS
eukprot:484764-Heterocapsa_arctica.AAC.1